MNISLNAFYEHQLKELAENNHMTVSEYIRSLIQQELKKEAST